MVLDHIDSFHPRGLLGVIDFPEVKNLPLNHFVVQRPVVLDNTPIAVLFSVFEPWFVSKEHSGKSTGENNQIKRVGRHYKENQGSDYVKSGG